MKDHYAITVSDLSGSRHYSVRKQVKTYFWASCLIVMSVIAVSFVFNYNQFNEITAINSSKQAVDTELSRYIALNDELQTAIENKNNLVTNISQELIEIEQISGVETGDQSISLEERIRLIGEFYNMKEETYSVIGNRVEHIEGLIGMDKAEEKLPHVEDGNLSRRVELASLNASQTRILHDSIPNGFPTDNKTITSRFGKRLHPVTKINSFHKGVDIRAKNHNPVFTTADGIVRDANFSKLSGNRIVVQHNFGFETRYSHLHKMHVKPGDVVHRGDLLALAGNTGRSDAPHLHYEIRYLGKAIDPMEFLDWEFGSDTIFTQVRGVKWPSLISLINKQITHQTLQLSQLDPNSLESLK